VKMIYTYRGCCNSGIAVCVGTVITCICSKALERFRDMATVLISV
jgi:hypothetical protein